MARQPPKCCCCVPLRPGLLAWGYVKLVFAFTLIGVYIYVSADSLKIVATQFYHIIGHGNPVIYVLKVLSPLAAYLLLLVFTIIFIIGVHRENSKLLRAFLVYSVFELITAGGVVGWQVYDFIIHLTYFSQYDSETFYKYLQHHVYFRDFYVRFIALVVVHLLLPIYLIVLVTSEVQRLKTSHKETGELVTKEQGRKYYFGDEKPDLRKPLFPVEELKRLRQQLGVKNV